MNIGVRRKGRVSILDMSGKLTIGEGDVLLHAKFMQLLTTGERLFIFNMSKVPFLDSAGLSEIAACKKRISERDGAIKLVLSQKGKTRKVFSITGLDKAFDIFGDEEEALASFIG